MSPEDPSEKKLPDRMSAKVKRFFSARVLMENWEYFRSIPKTLYFNLRHFPLGVAIKCPVFISHRVLLKQLGGTIELRIIKTGVVKIGFGDIPLFDSRKTRSVLILTGKIVFMGTAEIGPGCQFGIAGELVCGTGFAITANTTIATRKGISFGKNVMISWDVSIFDHDWHDISDKTGSVINPPKSISIGDDVWICCKALILKGCTIPNGIIVAAGTTMSGTIDTAYAIIGEDRTLRTLKHDVYWKK